MVLQLETVAARRVLYFHNDTEPNGPGFLHVLDNIDRHRYAPWVVLPGEGALQEELARRDIPVTVAPAKRVPRTQRYTALAQPGEVSKGRRIITEVTPHIVHINSTALELIYAGVSARLCAVPVVWRVSEMGDRETRSGMVAKLVRGCAARVVPVSNSASVWLGKQLNGQVVVIPEGVDTETFSPERPAQPVMRDRLGLVAGLPAIGHVGLIVPVKRVKDFIRAAAVVNRSADAQFVIVTNDPGRYPTLVRDLRKLAKELGIGRKTRFASVHTDLCDLMPMLDMVISSSASHSATPTLLKAAACGKPVIAPRTSAVSEGVVDGHTGILVDPGDIDALAGAMLTFIDDPELAARMGAAGRS